MTPASLADAPSRRADWARVQGVYGQFCKIVSDSEATFLPPAVFAFLAQALGRVSSNYLDDEATLAVHLRQVMAGVENDAVEPPQSALRMYFDARLIGSANVPSDTRFTAYNPPRAQRRRPTPFEAGLETCRRLRDLAELKQCIRRRIECAAILGGSLSYGRFLNVYGANWASVTTALGSKHYRPVKPQTPSTDGVVIPASDTDLVIVLDGYSGLEALVECVAEHAAVGSESAENLRRRVAAFDKAAPRAPHMFSHKVPMWAHDHDPLLGQLGLETRYLLSLHVFSVSDFKHLLLAEHPDFRFDEADEHKVEMRDFRPDEPNKRTDTQRSFTGRELRLERDYATFGDGSLGFVATTAVCVVREGRYYPGMYQNLILPRLEVRWDDTEQQVGRLLDAFRWKMVERLRFEAQRWPNEVFRLSMSHTRHEVFAPYVVASIDEGRIY